MLNIDLNPIVAREVRTRWRGRNSFLLVLGYTALVAIVVGFVYAYTVEDYKQTISLGRLAEAGRNLFMIATVMQSYAWMMLAPTLTATSIAGERERGLLEGLQLSPLTAWQIVWGKLLSSLTFALLIIAVSLPLTAVSFLLGGVSPGELCVALVLHLVAAITGASMGLLCSAWSRRGNVALRLAIIFVFVWVFGSMIGLSTGVALTLPTGIGAGSVPIGWLLLGIFVALSNPGVVAVTIATDETRGIVGSVIGVDGPVWLLSVIVQLTVSGLVLWLATRALRRPFAEQYWIERSQSTAGQSNPGQSTPGQGASAKPGNGRAPRMWWEIPIVAHWPFANPVLQREARGKFRMRQAPLWAIVLEGLLGLLVLYWYLRTLWAALFVPGARETIWWVLAFVALFVVMLASAVMGASAFTREREISTWESLNLSLLTPAEIIRGKLLAPLLACLVYSIPLWPLLLPCIYGIRYKSANSSHGISLTQAAGTLLIICATAWCYTAFGMFCSWRARSTTTAVGSTIGGIFVGLTFVPVFINIIFDVDAPGYLYHPIVMLAQVADPHGRVTLTALYSGLLIFGIGCGFLIWLHNSICANIREYDPLASHDPLALRRS